MRNWYRGTHGLHIGLKLVLGAAGVLILASCVSSPEWNIAVNATLFQDGVELGKFKDRSSEYVSSSVVLDYTKWSAGPILGGSLEWDAEVQFSLADHRSLTGSSDGTWDPVADFGIQSLTITGSDYEPIEGEAQAIFNTGSTTEGRVSRATCTGCSGTVDNKLMADFWVDFRGASEFIDDRSARLEGRITMRGFADPKESTDGDSDSGGDDCSNFSDTSDYYTDFQVNSQCLNAGYAEACGETAVQQASCDNISNMGASRGACPYC